jgi:ketosteroid isomerase-like protein
VTAISDLEDFRALEPFFRIVEQAIADVVDGVDFFDILAEDVVFDYVITVPDYPGRVVGRDVVAELYRFYGSVLTLSRCFDMTVHHDREAGVVVLEYASEGTAVKTGANYQNRYISVLTISGRKVVGWRDYLDPIAVFNALGWPSPPR